MNANASPTAASRWAIVISGGVLMGLSLGIRHTQGLFMQPVTSSHGWPLETFGLALAVQNLVWGLAQPVTGLVADRYGSGRVLCLGILAYGLGLYLMAQAGGPAGFIASHGVLIGIALSGTAFGTVYGALSRIFEPRRRGWALAVAGAIGGLGQFCLVPFVQHLLAGAGWQNAATVLGLLVLASLPLALPLRARVLEKQAGLPGRPPGASVRDALRRRGFWLLNLGFFACGFQLAFIAAYLPAYLLQHGLGLEQAGTALALIALANIFGTYACSRSAGLWRIKHLLAGLYAVRVAAMLLFLSMPVTAASAYAFALVMGFLWLGTAPMTNELVLRMFGLRYVATLFGIVFLGHQVGGFFGVWLGAWVYDRTHSYEWLWIGAIAIGCVAAAAHWLIDDTPLAASDGPGLRLVRP
ncbi:MFS transporter [Castellaniella defragrans]|uniref:Oxalate/formate antiporter n=2 Tax=Castellaniella defragrans TaxID=75697 RepID=W8X4F0_CASD6|nr:MFS transporter [Castellaniella defragrans]KAB0610270.1 MFS transporter [Castellaniella defragrans]MBB6082355.1 MFS family permease [Castellaniella defragrans]CDM24777.1 Oxalate/formate antiporter [Castellaniella defragrans 65Phen]